MNATSFVEDAIQIITQQTLQLYADYIALKSNDPGVHTDVRERMEKYKEIHGSLPSSAEETLAPLEPIYGKTLLHATAIALHGKEPVMVYVENVTSPSAHQHPSSPPPTGRWLYRVGEYLLYSPYYCPCSAYAFGSVRRKEVWCCKHLLALQITLQLKATGMKQDNIITRVVDYTTFQSLLKDSLARV